MNLKKWSKRIYGQESSRSKHELAPDEIFLDSSNLPMFDTTQFEGRIERPISIPQAFHISPQCRYREPEEVLHQSQGLVPISRHI